MKTVKALLSTCALALCATAAFAQTYGTWNDGSSSGGAGNWQGGGAQSGSTIINGQVSGRRCHARPPFGPSAHQSA